MTQRKFWEPWVAVVIAAMLYLRVAWGEWGGLVALAAELALALVMRARLMPRVAAEIELSADSLENVSDRVQSIFGNASSTILAAGMAASAFLLLYYASAGSAIVYVAPKAFVTTGYAIVCAIAFGRDAHHVSFNVIEPMRRRALTEAKPVEPAEPEEHPYDHLISQLVAMQLSHLEALNETNRLLAASASERVDEESGTVRVKLAKGLTDFRKSVEQLNGTVSSLGKRLDALADDESELLQRHRRELVSEVSNIPQQVIDRTAGLIATSIGQIEDRFRETLQAIHDEENRRARDLLAGEFHALRDQFEQTERSVSAIASRFNEVIASLDALAAAFDRSAKSVAGSAGEFAEALTQLGNAGETNASLLTPLNEAATAVRKASSVVAVDLRKVAAERERLGRVRMKILDLLPNGQEG